MDNSLKTDSNSPGISDVPGFACSGIPSDIRNLGTQRLDTAIIFSSRPCTAAGTFTTNVVKAAPVRVSMEALAAGRPMHGIVANSGNANACTGAEGLANAVEMRRLAAEGCRVAPETFFICSTGRIGRQLPMDKVRAGVPVAARAIGTTPTHGTAAADAILTSDTRPKSVTARFTHAGSTVTVSGIAKGAGMIQPNMATMFAFVATDAAVPTALLQKLLSECVHLSFNAITVDGDMSTNDTVLALANGASGLEVDEANAALLAKFREALLWVCQELADKIVSDGERITKVVEILVQGARTATEANSVARAIGNSLLVKTSWFGHDPNWGRLMDAAGYAGTPFREEDVSLAYSPWPRAAGSLVPVLEKGTPIDANLPLWKAVVRERRFAIVMDLGMGTASYRLLANDLSTGYVDYNKSE